MAWAGRGCWAMLLLLVTVAASGKEDPEQAFLAGRQVVGGAEGSPRLHDNMFTGDLPERSGRGFNKNLACMGAVYRRSSGGSMCLDTVTAAAVVGGVMVLKLLFYAAVSSVCPAISSSSLGSAGNVTNIITIRVLNGLDMDTTGGNMMQEQSQTETQTQSAMQSQTNNLDQIAQPSVSVDHDQTQTFMQTQILRDEFNARRRRRDAGQGGAKEGQTGAAMRRGEGRGWGLTDWSSLDICHVMKVYLAG